MMWVSLFYLLSFVKLLINWRYLQNLLELILVLFNSLILLRKLHFISFDWWLPIIYWFWISLTMKRSWAVKNILQSINDLWMLSFYRARIKYWFKSYSLLSIYRIVPKLFLSVLRINHLIYKALFLRRELLCIFYTLMLLLLEG